MVSVPAVFILFQMLLSYKSSLCEVVCDLRFAKRNKQDDFIAFYTCCSYPPNMLGKIASLVMNILIYR